MKIKVEKKKGDVTLTYEVEVNPGEVIKKLIDFLEKTIKEEGEDTHA